MAVFKQAEDKVGVVIPETSGNDNIVSGYNYDNRMSMNINISQSQF